MKTSYLAGMKAPPATVAAAPPKKNGRFFWRFIFPPIYGLVVYATIRLLLDSVTGMKFWERPLYLTLEDLCACLVFSYLFIAAFKWLLRWFARKWPSDDFSSKRIFRELFYLWLLNLVLQNAMLVPYATFTDDGLQWHDFVDINTIPLLYSLILYGIVRSNTFLKAYIDGKIQLEKITNDQLQTELKFLKAQYHPHFLFNALNTIYFQMDEDVSAAKKSVEKFSELLRYQLYDQQQTVPVSQEIRYLKNFIQLQQTRSSERLQLDTHFDHRLDGQLIYPLLFLPLVENAFKYVGGDYHLRIDAALCNDRIDFHVVNGIPAAADGIPTTVDERDGNDKGIGLENLKRRLELLYPGRHSLTTEKKEDSFTATLSIQYN